MTSNEKKIQEIPLKGDDEEPVQLDEVLSKLGAFGRHQLITMCMLALVYATNSIYNVNYVFAVEDVNYRCKIPECDSKDSSFAAPWLNISYLGLETDGLKQCHQHTPLNSQCLSFNTSLTEKCTDWVYDIPNSFVAEFGLACNDWKATLVGTIHLFGSMVGQLIQGQISDRFGRKMAAVFAGSMGAILGLAKSFSTSYWVYIVLEGLEAAIGDALSPMFMLSIEIVEKKRAILYQMILLNFYTCGQIIMPFIAWAVPYWRNFLRVIYAPTLIILFYSFFLDESIRWLFSKGKKEQGIRLIEKIAKRNNVKIDKNLLNRLDYREEDTSNKINDRKLLMETFRSRIMMQRFLVCMVWWFTITLINYGMMISSVLINGNKYLNFALLIMMDIPANILYWLALSKYKRKMPLIVSFIVGGVFCISQPFLPKGYAWLGLALFMAFEMLATFSYNIVYMYTSELFPTYTRNSMHSVCSAVGRVGSLLAPQTPLLVLYYTFSYNIVYMYTSELFPTYTRNSMHSVCSAVGRVGSLLAPQTPLLMTYWTGLPALIFGVCSLVSGALTLLMPETARTQLPDTIHEAETIGKRKYKYDPASETLKGT